jgi:hypothetical protein
MARPFGDQREHDQAQFAMIEHPAGTAPAPVAATSVIMRVSGVVVVVGSVAEVPSVAMAAVFVPPVVVISV